MKMRDVYVRNIIFGVADGLVSTVGLLAGMGVSGTPRGTIILTGVIYAFVEALSMAVGSFLSEESVDFRKHEKPWTLKPFIAGIVMFVSFAIASFIPLFPYTLAATSSALWASIAVSLVTLFAVGLMVGLFSHHVSRSRLFRLALKMVLLGGGAILLGVFLGRFMGVQ